MEVDPAKAKATYMYEGKRYFFCALGCEAKFEADPKKYLEAKEPKKM